MSTRILVLFACMALAFGAGVIVSQGYSVGRLWAPGPETASATPDVAMPAAKTFARPPQRTDLTDDEQRNIEVFHRAAASVVNVNSELRRRFWFDVHQIPRGSGTGFFWDDRGHVVTNYHVVAGGNQYYVTLVDQSTHEAELVGVAPSKDLAVLRIDVPARLSPALELGSSEDLEVGQKVLALGNPFGLDRTLTIGVVSALGRDLEAPDRRTIRNVIQTDAAINPGNSGGPLLDSRGLLVGVNTAISSPSGAFAGIGFAVPSQTVRELVPQLIRYGEPIRPGIGIEVLDDRAARQYGLEGIVITGISSGMPAERAGLEPVRVDRRNRLFGDIIVAVNGKRVRSVAELQDAFEEAGGVGARVRLTVENAGRRRDVEVTLVKINR